jgi:hypothetical protein
MGETGAMMTERISRRIDVEGVTWRAVRTASFCEFLVCDELAEMGFRSYTPIAQKPRTWFHNRRAPRGSIQQLPAFGRYIFCGEPPGQFVRRDTRKHIESILSDSRGPRMIPPAAIRFVNDLELAGTWDEVHSAVEKMGLREGDPVRFKEGPFAEFQGVVTGFASENRIKVLIDLFGRSTPVLAGYGQIEAT